MRGLNLFLIDAVIKSYPVTKNCFMRTNMFCLVMLNEVKKNNNWWITTSFKSVHLRFLMSKLGYFAAMTSQPMWTFWGCFFYSALAAVFALPLPSFGAEQWSGSSWCNTQSCCWVLRYSNWHFDKQNLRLLLLYLHKSTLGKQRR